MDTQLMTRILQEIEEDNIQDIENPFVSSEHDSRVNKTNIKCMDIAPDPKMMKQKYDFQNADFWYLKGYEHAHSSRNEVESAIDSYRQAIRLRPHFVQALHNLACMYEEQQRFQLGMKWFDIVIKLNPNILDSYHGYALCSFKNGNSEVAVKYLNIAIEQMKDEDINNRACFNKIYFRYLRSLCNKKLGKFHECQ